MGRVDYLYSTHTHKTFGTGASRIGTGVHMPAEQYFIVLHNNEWMISFKDKHYGPYHSQQEAIEAAIDCAYAMGDIGIDAQVLIQETDKELKTAWSYSLDFYTSGR
jgi:hypothetical protein